MKGNKKSNKQIEKAKDFKGTAKKIFKKYLLENGLYKWTSIKPSPFSSLITSFTVSQTLPIATITFLAFLSP